MTTKTQIKPKKPVSKIAVALVALWAVVAVGGSALVVRDIINTPPNERTLKKQPKTLVTLIQPL